MYGGPFIIWTSGSAGLSAGSRTVDDADLYKAPAELSTAVVVSELGSLAISLRMINAYGTSSLPAAEIGTAVPLQVGGTPNHLKMSPANDIDSDMYSAKCLN